MDGTMFGDGPNSRRLYFILLGITSRCVNDEELYNANGYRTSTVRNIDLPTTQIHSMATQTD